MRKGITDIILYSGWPNVGRGVQPVGGARHRSNLRLRRDLRRLRCGSEHRQGDFLSGTYGTNILKGM